MISSLLFLHATPDCGPYLLQLRPRLGVLAMAGEQPGLLGVEVAAAIDEADEIAIIGSWASLEHYERWRAGPVPGQLLEQIEDHVTSAPVERVFHIVEAVS
jgi:heme-degrading monooxygenase HmoA